MADRAVSRGPGEPAVTGEAWRASPAGNLGQRLCVSDASVDQGPGPDQFARFRRLSNPDQTLHGMENRLEDLPSRRARLDRSGKHSTDLRLSLGAVARVTARGSVIGKTEDQWSLT